MNRFFLAAGALLLGLGLLFLLIESLGVAVLRDPTPWMRAGGATAALVGVGLLTADVFLPVPSSFLMVAHGALFGVVPGMLLSLAGSLGAALLGFAVGRSGGPLLRRLLPAEERARADRLLERWGPLAVVVSRPLPLLAEAVAIVAGASPLGWGKVAAAALAGSLPPALLYALSGAVAGTFASAALVLALVLVVTALFWWVGRRVGGGPTPSGSV